MKINLTAFIFIGIGVLIIIKSGDLYEKEIRYDETCAVETTPPVNPCSINLNISSDLVGPIYFYYRVKVNLIKYIL